MHIIDIHTHIYPPKIALKATDSVRDFYKIRGSGNMDGTVELLRQRGAIAGISCYTVLPVSNAPDRVRSINSFILEQTQKYARLLRLACRSSSSSRNFAVLIPTPGTYSIRLA